MKFSSVLFVVFLIEMLVNYYMVVCEDHEYYGCNEYGVCLPGAEDIAVPPRTITATDTCGTPTDEEFHDPEKDKVSKCISTKHPAEAMIDRFNLTSWWQSQTWWKWYNNGNKKDPLAVNITISFNKSYVLTGEMKIEFHSLRPSKMVIEKSVDFGESWIPLQYFSDDCQNKYNLTSSPLNCSVDKILCNEKYSQQPPTKGPLYFSFLDCYTRQNFWNEKVQKLLNATDLKLRLELPDDDGKHALKNSNQMKRYYYAISDIQIYGRCQCNGHAENCKFPKNNGQYQNMPMCMCGHNTTGQDCEKCLPLYNNKSWMPATSNSQPNQCEKCQCHNHTKSCIYNRTLDHGVCEDCMHNTTGYFCEQCQDKFYRNFSKYLNDSEVCLACNCAVEGIVNNGTCSNDKQMSGQCLCKQNVTGRTCDRCNDTYYGYHVPPNIGSCLACNCNKFGTINGSLNCNQTTGRCFCKPNIDVNTCDHCKIGYHSFPNSTAADCLQCVCDIGGSTEDVCEKTTGTCLCRHGITGTFCSNVVNNHFYPKFDYLVHEAEYQDGNFTLIWNNAFIFTGQGFAKLNKASFINFKITVDVDAEYILVVRYAHLFDYDLQVQISGGSLLDSCPQLNETFTMKFTNQTSWAMNDTLKLCSHQTYSVYLSSSQHDANSSVLIDSLVLIPHLTKQHSYNDMKTKVEQCLKQFRTLQGNYDSSSSCENVTFANMVEFFNGSLPCNCSLIGSENSSCDPYGGQCYCKPGVIGRTCDRCQPGFYNLTNKGCLPCNCDEEGSVKYSVCHEQTGNCVCKKAVQGQQCDQCQSNHYGIKTGQGCQPCSCNNTGSVNGSCHIMTGQCFCQPGVTNDKCDECKINHFNFTKLGCQSCNCNKSGSKLLQCHNTSGICSCKMNVNGDKCDQCSNGTFGLEQLNPDGCSPCFCYNRTRKCLSASDYVLKTEKYINLTSQDGVLHITTVRGNYLYSYGRIFELVLPETNNTSIKIKLELESSQGDVVFHLDSSSCKKPEVGKYCVQLHEQFTNINTYRLQAILADLKTVKLDIKDWVEHSNFTGEISGINATLGTATTGINGDKAVHVEQCECPIEYNPSALSCGQCNKGFTRQTINSNWTLSRSSFTDCTLCSCNNRSKDCDDETGKCKNCRLSHGDSCETCSDGVDIDTACTACLPQYWSEDIFTQGSCSVCDCVLNNTLYQNSSVCNASTGQCYCEDQVAQGGRKCERCADNYFNTSYGCIECPECYGLIQDYVEMLKSSRKNLELVHNLFDADGYEKFGNHLNTIKNNINSLNKTAEEYRGKGNSSELNITLNGFKELKMNISPLLKNVKKIQEKRNGVENFVKKSRNLIMVSYDLLKNATLFLRETNESVRIVTDLKSSMSGDEKTLKILNDSLWFMTGKMNITTLANMVTNMDSVSKHAEVAKENSKNNTELFLLLNNSHQHQIAESVKNISTSHEKNVEDVFIITQNVSKVSKEFEKVIERKRNRVDARDNFTIDNYSELKENLSVIKEEVDKEVVLSNRTFYNSNEILTAALEAENKSINARKIVEETFEAVNKTLNIVKEFSSVVEKAEKQTNDSLKKIDEMNVNSTRTLQKVENMSDTVNDALKITTESVELSEKAKDWSKNESEVINAVYEKNVLFQQAQKYGICSKDLMVNFSNLTKSRYDSATKNKCRKRNETEVLLQKTKEIVLNSDESLQETRDTNNEVEKKKEKCLKTIDEIKNMEIKSVLILKEKLRSHFNNLTHELEILREDKNRRDEYIKELKSELELVEKEVRDMVSLKNSLQQDISICGKT